MSDRREMLLREYAEVTGNFRLLTDIRFKLLAFLPLAAGAAAVVLGRATPSLPALAFSLFGFTVTLGLVTYNARNDQLYNALIARAAAIERSLDDPDGAFANRPKPWLTLQGVAWRVDHGTGVATIYYASIALWLVSVADSGVGLVDDLVAGGPPAPWARPVAAGVAIVVTALGAFLVRARRRTTQRRLRVDARAAVLAVLDRDVSALDEDARHALVALGGADVEARLGYLAALPREEAAFYVRPGAGVWTAAQTVAYLTDFPPEWLYDCATGRRFDVGSGRGRGRGADSEATEGDPDPGALTDAGHPLR